MIVYLIFYETKKLDNKIRLKFDINEFIIFIDFYIFFRNFYEFILNFYEFVLFIFN